MNKGKIFTQLHEEERIKIEVLLKQGFSVTSIARTLARPVCTISREIKRNGPQVYRATRAQYFTSLRHRQKRKHTLFDNSMKDFIEVCLRSKRWSPELISVAGKQWRAEFISTEWIYQWIWQMKFSQAGEDKPYNHLYEYLRQASRRRKRGRKHHMRGNIIDRD